MKASRQPKKTFNKHVLRHDNLEEAVESGERAFVLKNYKKALELTLEVMSAADSDSSSRRAKQERGGDCVCLQTTTPLGGPTKAPVRMTPEISLVDRAAVVALQSSYELENDAGLTAFVSHYQKHSMPLDVAILWVQFVHSTDQTSAAELAAELLYHSHQYPSVSDSTEELALFLFVQVLPYSSSADYVQDLLDRIDATTWLSAPDSSRQSFTNDVNQQVVSMLLSRLDKLSLGISLNRCRGKLESLLVADEDKTSNEFQRDQVDCDDVLIESRSTQMTASLIDNLQSRDWYLTMSKQLLHLFRIHVIRPLFYDDDYQANRGRAALSALLMYLAWKKRRRLMLLTLSGASAITSPFREVLEALLPSKQR